MKIKINTLLEHLSSHKLSFSALLVAVFMLAVYLRPEGPTFSIGYMEFMNGWYGFIENTGGFFQALKTPFAAGFEKIDMILSPFNLGVWIYLSAGPFWGHLINEFLIRLIAFWGMALLLKRHVTPQAPNSIIYGSAAIFACMPFYVGMFASIAGGPFFIHAFLNIIKQKSNRHDWLIMAVYPLYSFVLYAYIHFVALGVIYIFNTIKMRKIDWQPVGAMALSTLVSVLTILPLAFRSIFREGFVSQREEGNLLAMIEAGITGHQSIIEAVIYTFKQVLLSQYTELSYHAGILPIVAGVALLAVLPKMDRRTFWLAIVLGGTLLGGIFFNRLWQTVDFQLWLAQVDNPVVHIIQWNRTQQMTAWLMVVLFALGLTIFNKVYNKKNPYLGHGILVLVIIQVGILFYYHPSMMGQRNGKRSIPSYQAFNASVVFDQIAQDIGKDKSTYKVGAFGLPVAAVMHNGFYTVDFFSYNYDLNYKHKFRKVIAKELEKDDKLKANYDHWGQRVFLFSSELGQSPRITKDDQPQKVKNLALDIEAFKNLGGEYIFSAVDIQNAADIGLKYIQTYTSPTSAWKIRVYKAL